MFIEQAACSGVEGRANLTVAAVAVKHDSGSSSSLGGVFGTNDILEHTAWTKIPKDPAAGTQS